jgi:tetratricopeptide (TPR) repeat protein
MSRRGVPPLSPSDLRDHADEARVARIWDRLEQELAPVPVEPERRTGGLALALGAAAAFGAGVWLGASLGEPRELAVVASAVPSDAPGIDVLAAGTSGRSFPLPGGGRLTLGPGATVELERGAGAITLRLVQGEASIDAEGAEALAIVADEARLSTQAGSAFFVRRSGDTLDVRVSEGAVALESPAGSQQIGRGQEARAVPLRQPIGLAAPEGEPARQAPIARGRLRHDAREGVASAGSALDWRARYTANDWDGALSALDQQGGLDAAIDAAKSAEELMWISDLAEQGGLQASAVRAKTQVIERFPNAQHAEIARIALGDLYEKMGDTERSREYLEKVKNQELAEQALCGLMRGEQRRGNKKEASERAAEYGVKYPNGPCRDEAEQILHGEETPAEDVRALDAAPTSKAH